MVRGKGKSRAPQTPSPTTAFTKRAVGILVFGALALVASSLIFADWYRTLPTETKATYVGRQTCVQCHQQQAQLFAQSHHDKAMDRATPETVLGDFNNATLTHFDITSRMYRDGDRYMVHTEGPDGKMGDFEVKYVFGVAPLQNYMVEFDRPANMPANEIARVQVLRIAWNTEKQEWFYLPPPDVDEKLDPSDDLHWTGIAQRWNTMCADCHSTNVVKNFDSQSLRYHTTFSEIDVSCEACHGPGSTHVQLANRTSLFWDRQLGYGLTAKLKGPDPEPQIQACAECHARRELIAGGYESGDNYWDHFSTALLGPLTYHADGQIEDEDFEHGSFLQSKMYHKGIRCTDCHDPHTAKLKHEGNKLCTSCHQHPAGKYDTPLHHHHKEGTEGASCVSCHMPTTTYMEVHVRHDHSLRVPRPDLSVDLGTPNACTSCHLDQKKLRQEVAEAGGDTKPAQLKQYLNFLQAARGGNEVIKKELARLDQWSADAVKNWYGPKPKAANEPAHFAYALAAARRREPQAEALLEKVISNRTWPGIVRASALQEWQAFGSQPMLAASAKALEDPNVMVRAVAAANLISESPERKAKLLAPLLHDPDFAVRRNAARSLAECGRLLSGKDRSVLQVTLNQWIAGLLENNDRGGVQLAIGSLQEQVGDIAGAEAAYREAIHIEPGLSGARANLAAVLDTQLQNPSLPLSSRTSLENQIKTLREEEFELLARDARLVPNNAAIQYQYGLALYLREQLEPALTALGKAVELEPRTADFRLAYALLLHKMGRIEAAIVELETVLEQQPAAPGAQQLLQDWRKSK